MHDKFHYECVNCGREYPGDGVIYLCPACQPGNIPGQPPGGVLKTVYRYDLVRARYHGRELFERLLDEQFLSLLPLRGMASWPHLRIGETPLYEVSKWTGGRADNPAADCRLPTAGCQLPTADCQLPTADCQLPTADYKPPYPFELFLKDDSQNPTFSFKDRASALVSAWAHEHGIGTLIAASTGNAGSSLAGICACQGQEAIVVVPASAPLAKLTQVLMYGATLVPVHGTYDDAYDLSVQLTEKHGWYNRNTAFNPLTIEGKKTVSFELYRQLGFRVPDRIFIPVGDGVIYSGVCKGFEDLLKLGITDRMPVAVAVQAAGSSNLVGNLDRETFVSTPSGTIADSISVDIPRCFHMTAKYIREYDGETVTVSEQEILQASVSLSRSTGIFCEPAAAAAYAGMMKYNAGGKIPAGSKNVVLLTGSGLKDLKAVQGSIKIPETVEPDMISAEKLLSKKHLIP